jgi:hypothetical protein
MNVIQQEAVAKAMGMSRDTMGGMLLEQEAISKLSQGDTEENRKKLAMLKERGFSMQAIAELGQEELDRQMESASMQDKFNASVEKLKEVFVGVAQSLMPILDILSSVFGIVGKIVAALDSLGAGGILVAMLAPLSKAVTIMKVFKAEGFKAAIVSIFKSFSQIPFGLGIPLAIAAVTGLGALMSKAGDVNSPADGKTQISTKEGGLFELSKNDDLVAFPGASKALSNKNQPVIINQPSAPVQQAPQIDYDKMAQAMSRVKVQTNLDGVRVSSELQKAPLGMATRKI